MDLTDTVQPKSDQANADDFVSGPRTFTIADVRRSESAEQPVDIHLKEFPAGRPWKPNKSMRRVLIQAWGVDAANYVGRRVTLYCDKSVRWAGAEVGGIRVSHLSHIEKPLTMALTVTRGKRAPYVVKPLIDLPDQPEFRTADQSKRLAKLISENKLEKTEALGYFASVIGREIESTQELTKVEAAKVIEALEASPGFEDAGTPEEPAGWEQ